MRVIGELDVGRKTWERKLAAAILKIDVKWRLRMDEDHLWIIEVAVIKGGWGC